MQSSDYDSGNLKNVNSGSSTLSMKNPTISIINKKKLYQDSLREQHSATADPVPAAASVLDMGATVTAVGPSNKKDKQLRVVPLHTIQAKREF